MTRSRLRHLTCWSLFLILLSVVLASCGPSSSGQEAPTSTVSPAPGTPITGSAGGPCGGGRLTIGDLDEIDAAVESGLAEARRRAGEWQPDAVLVAVRVGCELLAPEFHWRATFFSERVQTYFFSDTRETEVAAADGRAGDELRMEGISFNDLGLSLLRAGNLPTVTLDPGSNVEVRVNTAVAPFGPPNVPEGAILFHVALESRGEVVDLFVDAADGTVYQYPR